MIKASMQTAVAILLFLSCEFTNLLADPISTKDLFRRADTYSFQLSPSSKYIAKNYFRGKNYDVLEIIDVKSGRVADAFRVKVKKFAFIRDYKWVDDDTLYIEYRLKEHQERRMFLDIDYDVFQNTDDEISTTYKFESEVEIIDPLSELENKVLVQKKKGEEYELYTATTQEVISNKFKVENKFAKHLEGALGYHTNAEGSVQFTATIQNKKLKIWYLDNYESDWVELFEFGEFDFSFEPVAIIDETTMLVITNKDTDTSSLVEFDYVNKKLGKVLYQHEKYDLIDAEISTDSGDVKSVSYFENGHLKTEYFSKKNKSLDSLVRNKFPGKQYYIHSRRKNSNVMVLFVFSADDPGSYHWLDSKEKIFKDLGPSHSYLSNYSFSPTKVFTVKSDSGTEIEAILTVPSNKNGVLLVAPHGGPVGVRDLDVFNRSNQFYASRGYSILNVNFRGSSGYGKKFLTEGRGQFGRRIEQDITLAVNKVNERYQFDKTCSIGASYGGYSAVILAAYHPGKYDCIIGAYGIYDLPLLFNASNYQMSEENLKRVSNTVGEYSDSLKDYSPVYFAEKIEAPVLLIAGVDDNISGFEQTNRMKYRLKQLGKDVEFLAYKDTGHGHRDFYWEAHEHLLIEEFMRRKLGIEQQKGASSEMLGNEYIRLADGYAFDNKLDKNVDKAIDYYRKAAQHDEPRALHNLGSYHQRGRGVEKDILKALEYYQQASSLGYVSSTYRLGLLHKYGGRVGQDLKKSLGYFTLAKSQEKEDKDELKKIEEQLSHLGCLGYGSDISFESCLAYIKRNLSTDSDNILYTIRDVLFANSKSNDELSSLIELLANYDYLEGTNNTDFDVEDYGRYEYSQRKRRYVHDSTDVEVEMNRKERVGVTISFDNDDASYRAKVLYKVTWHHPEFKKGHERRHPTKVEELYYTSFNNEVVLTNPFETDYEKVEGDWRVVIESLSGSVMLDKTFSVTLVSE